MPTTLTIQWHGLSCFRVAAKLDRSEAVIVTDPYDPSRGAKLPRNLEADIVTVSHDHLSHNYVEGVGGEKFVIRGPGEYEVKGVFVYGIASGHGKKEEGDKGVKSDKGSNGRNTLYRIEVGDLSLAHLGDLGHELTDKELEQLQNVDILFVPIGGAGVTIGSKIAAEIVSQVEPRIVIPMHFRLPDFKETLEPVDKFLKEMGGPRETVEKLKITKKDLLAEETKVIVMTRS